jgi:HAE1 family hydrophobic/amphiphilic exporter-1
MYAQFALVIAATALLSAINAATLKPTQSAMWLRRRSRPSSATSSIAASTRSMTGRAALCAADRPHGQPQRLMAIVRSSSSGCRLGFTRIATGFLPIEDQGYLITSVQLPDGASLERTQKVLDRVTEIARKTPGVREVVTIAGLSALDNSSRSPTPASPT